MALQLFKISVINDEPKWGKSEINELRKNGFIVTRYPSTSTLISFLNFPNLFIVNIATSNRNAFSMVEKIRAQSAQVGILLVISLENQDDRATVFLSGADNYIVRPYEIEEFLAIVCSIASRLQ